MTSDPNLAPIVVASAWLAFFGSHVFLGPVLRSKLRPQTLLLLYVPVAWVTFTGLCWSYATHRHIGPVAFDIHAGWLRWALYVGSITGVVLMMMGALTYPKSPMRVLRRRTARAHGVQLITRHPFFVGVALWGMSHALLSSRMTGMISFGGLAFQAGLGSWLQDRKLIARRGPEYAAFVAETSVIPFFAIARGKQRLSLSDIPVVSVGVGLAVAFLLRYFHESLWTYNGLGVAAVVIVASTAISLGVFKPNAVRPRHEPSLLERSDSE